MAMGSWLDVEPLEGSGNGEVSVSSKEMHTGREARESVITFKAVNCENVERTVKQAGMTEFVEMDQQAASAKEGQTVTIYGESNAPALTFSLGSGDLDVELPDTYTANSVETENGAEIEGDPGATQSYEFSLRLVVAANEGVDELTRQIVATDTAGNTAICTLIQAAGEPYLIIEEGDINLDYLGTEVSVKVESNTNWTVE